MEIVDLGVCVMLGLFSPAGVFVHGGGDSELAVGMWVDALPLNGSLSLASGETAHSRITLSPPCKLGYRWTCK